MWCMSKSLNNYRIPSHRVKLLERHSLRNDAKYHRFYYYVNIAYNLQSQMHCTQIHWNENKLTVTVNLHVPLNCNLTRSLAIKALVNIAFINTIYYDIYYYKTTEQHWCRTTNNHATPIRLFSERSMELCTSLARQRQSYRGSLTWRPETVTLL